MRLTTKITLAVGATVLAVMAVHDYLLVRREVQHFDSDLQRSVPLKRALRASVDAVWLAQGETAARELIEKTISNELEGVQGRLLWLDARPGDPNHVDLGPAELEQLRSGERVVFFRRDEGSNPERYTYVPIPVSLEGGRVAVLKITESIQAEHAFIQTNRAQVLGATVVILVLCTASAYAIGVWFVGRPMRSLRDKARAVGGGDFGAPLHMRQHDEIGELAEEINAMCGRLAELHRRLADETEARITAIEQMRHTDRLTTMGQLASGVAHELGTPLSVITGRAEMIVTGEAEGAKATACARTIVEQAAVMTALIRRLLDFSRRQGPRFGVVSLRAMAARSADMLASFARKRGVTIDLAAAEGALAVSADENQIQQALTNVLMNAIQSMPAGGRVTIDIGPRRACRPGAQDVGETDYLCVCIQDQGEGIAPDNLDRIFEPFFTTKGVGEGTGLGLSVAYGIVQEHGGWIQVESQVGKGTRFSIYLPPAEEGGRGRVRVA